MSIGGLSRRGAFFWLAQLHTECFRKNRMRGLVHTLIADFVQLSENAGAGIGNGLGAHFRRRQRTLADFPPQGLIERLPAAAQFRKLFDPSHAQASLAGPLLCSRPSSPLRRSKQMAVWEMLGLGMQDKLPSPFAERKNGFRESQQMVLHETAQLPD